MKPMSARAAKNTFGMMMDIALAVSALIEKHGRGIVMIMSVEEYE
ncbi:MAG: type II toxin-antitoxin system Phd/YefM family antitoxin [Acidobacteriia bacterium]|nr:type II toxin-antitoxin system Phd/YefM family antitoxin [Methyloceanibacter sp.]MCL6492029.1 type II toxin-antitoxin system Phd/YefM family antitoxin [Terriglobia bacterium]